MARIAKRLAQTALSSSVISVVTSGTASTTQIVEVYISNTGTTSRTLTFYTNGTASTNTIITGLAVSGTSSVILEDKKIILGLSEVFYAKQDAGADVVITCYGVEES